MLRCAPSSLGDYRVPVRFWTGQQAARSVDTARRQQRRRLRSSALICSALPTSSLRTSSSFFARLLSGPIGRCSVDMCVHLRTSESAIRAVPMQSSRTRSSKGATPRRPHLFQPRLGCAVRPHLQTTMRHLPTQLLSACVSDGRCEHFVVSFALNCAVCSKESADCISGEYNN